MKRIGSVIAKRGGGLVQKSICPGAAFFRGPHQTSSGMRSEHRRAHGPRIWKLFERRATLARRRAFCRSFAVPVDVVLLSKRQIDPPSKTFDGPANCFDVGRPALPGQRRDSGANALALPVEDLEIWRSRPSEFLFFNPAGRCRSIVRWKRSSGLNEPVRAAQAGSPPPPRLFSAPLSAPSPLPQFASDAARSR